MLPGHELLKEAESSWISLDLLHARISGAARLHWVNKENVWCRDSSGT